MDWEVFAANCLLRSFAAYCELISFYCGMRSFCFELWNDTFCCELWNKKILLQILELRIFFSRMWNKKVLLRAVELGISCYELFNLISTELFGRCSTGVGGCEIVKCWFWCRLPLFYHFCGAPTQMMKICYFPTDSFTNDLLLSVCVILPL